VEPLGLEDMVLAYLAAPAVSTGHDRVLEASR
jgi:hypothetical protein